MQHDFPCKSRNDMQIYAWIIRRRSDWARIGVLSQILKICASEWFATERSLVQSNEASMTAKFYHAFHLTRKCEQPLIISISKQPPSLETSTLCLLKLRIGDWPDFNNEARSSAKFLLRKTWRLLVNKHLAVDSWRLDFCRDSSNQTTSRWPNKVTTLKFRILKWRTQSRLFESLCRSFFFFIVLSSMNR